MSHSDDRLVQLCLDGQIEAGRELYLRYALFLYHAAYRMTFDRNAAEEICQESWLRIFKRLDTYKPNTNFRAWIASICYRLAIDYLRKKNTREKVDALSVRKILHQIKLVPRQIAEQSEFLERVGMRLRAVPAHFRLAFHLRYFEDMSYRDISKVLGCSERTARSKVSRAVRMLRDYLDDRDLYEGGVV